MDVRGFLLSTVCVIVFTQTNTRGDALAHAKATNTNMKLIKQFTLTDDNGKTIKYYQYTTGSLVDGTLRSVIVKEKVTKPTIINY